MKLSTLSEWLSYIGSVHQTEIELGLERVRVVGDRLDLLLPRCAVVIVGGTNGKGSTVAGLEAIYRAAGYQVGAFTSPILFKHNEEVRINGEMAEDAAFCEAFEKIESARGAVSLTPFEYHTLAALLIFQNQPLDVILLEIGLGGRLDAVNILDADVAIVTSIGIDHVEWLGSTREAIAKEKAGIFRQGKPAVCGDAHPPAALIDHAREVGACLFVQGQDFDYTEPSENTWSWWAGHPERSEGSRVNGLPLTALYLENLSTVMMAVNLLQDRLPVTREKIICGLAQAALPGRIQVVPGAVTQILDVSHNPHSVALLSRRLRDMPCPGKTFAVFSMLADKDIEESVKILSPLIDAWFVSVLENKRAASRQQLQTALTNAQAKSIQFADTIQLAYHRAMETAETGDRIIVFGSFHTVAAIMPLARPQS